MPFSLRSLSLALVALLVVSCGDDATDSTTSTQSTSTEVASDTSTPVPGASGEAEVAESQGESVSSSTTDIESGPGVAAGQPELETGAREQPVVKEADEPVRVARTETRPESEPEIPTDEPAREPVVADDETTARVLQAGPVRLAEAAQDDEPVVDEEAARNDISTLDADMDPEQAQAYADSQARFAEAWAAFDLEAEEREGEADDIWGWLSGGTVELDGRYRLELVDDNGFPKHGAASTLLTNLRYRTGRFHDVSGLIEVAILTPLGDDSFNDTVNGQVDRPLIPDAGSTELNQAYLDYTGLQGVDVRFGRQILARNNQRFVGADPWRQNDQTFDALNLSTRCGRTELSWAFLENANRIYGDDSPIGDEPMNTHLFDATYTSDLARWSAYWYRFDVRSTPEFSTSTVGTRLELNGPKGPDWSLDYVVEVAQQTDARENPNDLNANYLAASARFDRGSLGMTLGYERLGGSGNPGDQFITPFGSLFAFNGWTDRFLTTPDGGLEDLYLQVETVWEDNQLLAAYHQFEADEGGDYGSELDLRLARPLNEHMTLGLQTAWYKEDGFGEDVSKYWLWLNLRP